MTSNTHSIIGESEVKTNKLSRFSPDLQLLRRGIFWQYSFSILSLQPNCKNIRKLFRKIFFKIRWQTKIFIVANAESNISQVDDLRGTPMSVGNLEEIIDDNHAIVSTSVGSEHYVSILSFVDKDQLEPGCSVLLNHKVNQWGTKLCFYTGLSLRVAYVILKANPVNVIKTVHNHYTYWVVICSTQIVITTACSVLPVTCFISKWFFFIIYSKSQPT